MLYYYYYYYETGVFPSLDRLSGTLCLSHYVTETSHLNSLRHFWRHFGLCRAVAHSDWCFFAPCINILTYLLTYLLHLASPLGRPRSNFANIFGVSNTVLGVLCVILRLVDSGEHRLVIDKRTDGQTCNDDIYRPSIASSGKNWRHIIAS